MHHGGTEEPKMENPIYRKGREGRKGTERQNIGRRSAQMYADKNLVFKSGVNQRLSAA